MENAPSIEGNTASTQDCCAPAVKSRWPNQRNVLIGVALLGGTGALFFGWDWLVAAGVASIIVAMAPCLVMCGLGLCMSRKSKSQTSTTTTSPGAPVPDAQQVVKTEPPSEPLPGGQK